MERTSDNSPTRYPHPPPPPPLGPSPATAEEVAADTILNLQRALLHSRDIGAAVGILMERHALTYDDAWRHLVHASQVTNSPVHKLAAELLQTGYLNTQPGAGNSSGSQAPRR